MNCCEFSFHASPGWDAVTGLGSPNFDIISNLVINNATAFPNVGAYPAGSSANVASTDDGDDDSDETKLHAHIALGLACGGVALALIALAFIAYNYSRKPSGNGQEAGNPMH